MTRPTFSILVDSEENTNLAIKQLTQIALEQGIITEQELEEMDKQSHMGFTFPQMHGRTNSGDN